MQLYVANGTRQVHNFAYRLPGDQQPYQSTIPIGMQIRVPHDMTKEQLDYVVKHHKKYGMLHHSEVPKAKNYVGLVYNIDAPVPRKAIDNSLQHNNDVLNERGREIRKKAGVAAHNEIAKTLAQNPGLADLGAVDMSITEESKAGQEGGEALKEEIFVSNDVSQDEHNTSSKKPRNKTRRRG